MVKGPSCGLQREAHPPGLLAWHWAKVVGIFLLPLKFYTKTKEKVSGFSRGVVNENFSWRRVIRIEAC